MATTFDFLSSGGALGPSVPPSPSGLGRDQANFPAEAEPLLNIVSEAGPQHLTADLLQAAHAKLPQPQLGLQPKVRKFRHRTAQAIKGSGRVRLHLGHVRRYHRHILSANERATPPPRRTLLVKCTI